MKKYVVHFILQSAYYQIKEKLRLDEIFNETFDFFAKLEFLKMIYKKIMKL